MRTVSCALVLFVGSIFGGLAQEKPVTATQAARPMRTEAEARARAEANRREREQQRVQKGAPVELIPDYMKANIGPVPESLGVSPFYKKYTDALGIPVIASEKVPDAALLVARDIVNSMLAGRPDIRKALIARNWRTGVIAEVEMTMDIPEYSKMKRPGAPQDEPVTQADRDYHANRSRGLGGNPTTGAEENLLGYPGTRYWGEHIFVHEFAHAMMRGLRDMEPAAIDEIRTAYDAAMAAKKYVHADGRKHYATTNPNEYWAEGVQWWFFSNYGECFDGNVKVETPEEFAAYDPALNELISRVFTTHRIPMDVFHGKRIRPVACGASSQARPIFADGQAQIVPEFQDSAQWIRERLWVETEFDSDKDGHRDRMFVDVTRQRQTDTEGLKVPIIYESSPYYAGTSGNRQFLWNVKQEVGAEPPPRTSQPAIAFRAEREGVSTSHVNTWVPRGFAVVHSDAPGTGLSQGCPTVGSDPEQLAPKAVIDWLNGRAKGFRTADGNDEVPASWSTGKVGMTGTSYNGTIPLAAAVTGVPGLEAVIPVAPNTSYYHYYRSNGLVRHPGGWLGEDIDFLYDFVNSGDPSRREQCNRLYRDGEFVRGRDRASGDYNDFWRARDLLTKVNNIRAAVFMAHAFNDWNVVPEHSVRIYEALKGRVPLRAYYHQGGHGGAPPLEMMNKWFTRYLYGVENGVEREPKAWIVRETTAPAAEPATQTPPPAGGTGRGRGRAPIPPPLSYPDYPNPAATPVTFSMTSGGSRIGGLTADGRKGSGRETLVDNVEFAGAALAATEASPHRLLYATSELTAPVHISGTPRVTIRVASSKPAANLSVWMVVLPWTEGPISPTNLITRGWADPQNHRALRTGGNYDSDTHGEPLVPGRFVDLTFDLQPDDQIIPAGKRIGLMIFSSDRDFTVWPSPGTELTVDLEHTSLQLPVVGGKEAMTMTQDHHGPEQSGGPEQVIRSMVIAMYSNDVSSYNKLTVPHPLRSRLTEGGRVNQSKLDELKEHPSGLQIIPKRPPMLRGEEVQPDSKGDYPVGTTALFVVAHGGGPMVVTTVRRPDGWKVDLRWWIAMMELARGREPTPDSAEWAIRSLLSAMLRLDRQSAARFAVPDANMELLFDGAPRQREPSGVLDAAVAEMPLVEIEPGEFARMPTGKVVEGVRAADRKVIVGLFGPVEIPFVVRRVGGAWRVDAEPYFALMLQ